MDTGLICTTTGWWTTNRVLVIANLVLAAVALYSIRSSNRVAKASEVQATKTAEAVRIENLALLASVRPFLVGAREIVQRPYVYDNVDGETVLNVPVRNVGTGVAIVKEVTARSEDGSLDRTYNQDNIIPVGEMVNVDFEVGRLLKQWRSAGGGHRAVLLAIKYSDVNDVQRWESVLHLSVDSPGAQNFHIDRLRLFECDEHWDALDQPSVSTGRSELPPRDRW